MLAEAAPTGWEYDGVEAELVAALALGAVEAVVVSVLAGAVGFAAAWLAADCDVTLVLDA